MRNLIQIVEDGLDDARQAEQANWAAQTSAIAISRHPKPDKIVDFENIGAVCCYFPENLGLCANGSHHPITAHSPTHLLMI